MTVSLTAKFGQKQPFFPKFFRLFFYDGYDDDDDDGGNDDDNHVDDDDEEEEADSDDEMIKRRIAGVQSNRQLQRIKWQILSLPPSLSLHLSLCTPRPCKSIAMG